MGTRQSTVRGGALRGIEFAMPASPSAQVKSAVLLAGLDADGRDGRCASQRPTRDHTERALLALGAPDRDR